MKRVVLIAICLALLIIENTILPYYSIKGAFPSLLFVFAIAYSMINGKWEAVFIGITAGFFQDIFFFNGFGVNILVNMLLCQLAAYVGENIFKENRIIPAIACFVISAIKVLMVTIIMLLFNYKIDIEPALISALMNAIIMLLIYKIVLTTSEKYIIKDSWRFR